MPQRITAQQEKPVDCRRSPCQGAASLRSKKLSPDWNQCKKPPMKIEIQAVASICGRSTEISQDGSVMFP